MANQKVLLFDVESSLDGVIRCMCLMKAEIGPKPVIHETRKYIISDQYDFQMFFNPENKSKFIHELVSDAPSNFEMKGTFYECITDIMAIVKRNTGHVFVTFCADNDFRFLHTTDTLQRDRFFPRHPLTFPEDFPIPINCAFRILSERCPKTNQRVSCGTHTLNSYLSALCDRQQTHFVVQDTLDLYEVLQTAWTLDLFEFPRTTYMYTKAHSKTHERTV